MFSVKLRVLRLPTTEIVVSLILGFGCIVAVLFIAASYICFRYSSDLTSQQECGSGGCVAGDSGWIGAEKMQPTDIGLWNLT